RDAEPAAPSEPGVALLPAARRLDRVQALEDPAARDVHAVDRRLAAPHGVAAPDLDGIELQLLGELVERGLEGEARLHRAVAALGPAAGLVGVDPPAAEPVGPELERAGEQLTGVVGRDEAEAVE